tara:strand:+ start:1230 stop:1952 length:723 start_codon:yes stop_codon:yes gene_type:complete
MNKLCLDIGNTSIAYCEVDKKIQSINRLSKDSIKFFNDYDISNIDQVIISSVVPNLSNQIAKKFKLKNLNVFEVSFKNCGLELMVKNPSEVGNDRICNIAAANKIYGGKSIIIDFGTATTYDVVNENGAFIGGAIAPGIDVSADNLISKASLLKETIYQFPNSVIGDDTESNIQSGVMFSGVHAVKGMVNQIKKEIEFLDPYIILTGGFGKLISEGLNIDHIYNKNLTIEGMVDIYKNFK